MLSIKQRQMNLQFLGYYLDKIDGIEGKNTIKAYRLFQTDYNLIVDGIYGTVTDRRLIEVIKEIQKELGVSPDGIAGAITIKARELKNLNWNNIKYFKKEEFTCKCGCGLNNINLYLVKLLDEIREYFGNPIIITSGTRCARHNKAVQGVSNSRHVLGKASDIIVKNVPKEKVLLKCQEYVNQGKARYTYTNNTNMGNAVHIDIN